MIGTGRPEQALGGAAAVVSVGSSRKSAAGMSAERLAEVLAERLAAKPRVDGAEVVGWRFDLSGGWSVRAGLKDGRLGGPYEPPAASHGSGGSAYLRWSDGTCSHADVDSRTLDDLDERLAEWRANAYADSGAPDILAPGPLPNVQTADPAVETALDGDPGALIEPLRRAREQLAVDGFERIHADSGAGHGRRFVYNSRGLRVMYPETSASFYLAVEELYWRSYGKRRLPREAELAELVDDVGMGGRTLRQPADAPVGELPLLLAPGLAMSFVGTFLVANLGGSAVVAGRSAYSLDDFRAARQVMRDDLSLALDSTLDLEGAASPVSAEGVPGGRALLVEHGRLRRPQVDLKYAARSGFPPTPVPGGAPGFLLESRRPLRPAAEVRAELAIGLELHAVLGLRTQDSASGRYSLVAPQARVIVDGRAVGRGKVSLAGSAFDHLLDERTELVAYPWSVNPGLLIWTAVERQA